jgi:hypothetical protein
MVGRLMKDELGWKIVAEEDLGYLFLMVIPFRVSDDDLKMIPEYKEGDEIEFIFPYNELAYMNSTMAQANITQAKYDIIIKE